MGTEECVINLDSMVIVHRNVSPCPRFDQSEASLLAHAESLTPSYLHEEDVNVLRSFISQVEKPPTAQESVATELW
ncbi:hypothetical protein Hanom_Chr01g00019961 [Helianthus anomalus]